MKFNAEEANHLIRNRRSIYPGMYTGDRVSDEVIENMLENANWAPTHKLTEPWRFKVFCDEGKDEFLKIHKKAFKKAGKKFDEAKLEGKLKKTSHVISIAMKRDKVVPEMEEVAAVAAAVQNMQLTATAHGAGCYWSTGGVTFLKEARKVFDLKKSDLLMGFLFIGVPKKWPKGKRKSIDKKVGWVRK